MISIKYYNADQGSRRYENMNCKKHNCEMLIRERPQYSIEPWEFYCPHCEAELKRYSEMEKARKVRMTPEERELEKFADWVKMQTYCWKKDIASGKATWEEAEDYLTREVKIRFRKFFLAL